MTFAKVLNTAVTFEMSFNSVSMLQKFKDSGGNKLNEWIFEMKSQIGKCTRTVVTEYGYLEIRVATVSCWRWK